MACHAPARSHATRTRLDAARATAYRHSVPDVRHTEKRAVDAGRVRTDASLEESGQLASLLWTRDRSPVVTPVQGLIQIVLRRDRGGLVAESGGARLRFAFVMPCMRGAWFSVSWARCPDCSTTARRRGHIRSPGSQASSNALLRRNHQHFPHRVTFAKK